MKKQNGAKALTWTGEYLVTSCRRPLIYEHLHRYALAVGLAKGKRVLDIACGEGYGANLLADVASRVVGVDINEQAIAHAQATYNHPNLQYVQGSCTEIPCPDQSIDLVASFETIEHLKEHDLFLREVRRVLAPGGILLISSPHKAEYRKISAIPNPFHEAELNHEDFVRLIKKTFKRVVSGKQRLVLGSWIAPDSPSAKVSAATFRGWFDGIDMENGVYRGLYSIVVCSDRALPTVHFGMFENFRDSAEMWNLLDSYDEPAHISARIFELTRTNKEETKQLIHLQQEFEKKAQHVTLLQRENEEKAKQVAHFKQDADERARHLALLQRDHEEKAKQLIRVQQEFEEKARHVRLLQHENEEKTKQVAHFKQDAEERAKQVAQLRSENGQHAQLIERLKERIECKEEQLGRVAADALDARWELLRLRGNILREENAAGLIAELELRLEAMSSERDQLRAMVIELQRDFQVSQDQLARTTKDVQSLQKRFDRLRERVSRKLILPFGPSQRKLQELIANEPRK